MSKQSQDSASKPSAPVNKGQQSKNVTPAKPSAPVEASPAIDKKEDVSPAVESSDLSSDSTAPTTSTDFTDSVGNVEAVESQNSSTLKYNGSNPMFIEMFGTLVEFVSAYSSKNTVLKAATEGRDAAIEAYVKTSADPEAVKIREGIATLEARLRELAESNVTTSTLSEDEQTNVRREVDELRGKIRTGIQAAQGVLPFVAPGGDPDADSFLTQVSDLIRAPRGRAPGSKLTGDMLPRTNVVITVTGGMYKGSRFDTMSAAAKAIKMELKDFQLAFAEAAGVEHSEIGSVKTPQMFTVKPHDAGSSYSIVTAPKDVQKPGRKPSNKGESVPAENSASADTSENTDQTAM